jgi:DNA invertase Pin-like site-specific DNA recombinase
MTCRPRNRGLVYLRRSDPKQGLSLPTQLNWAIDEAQRLGVPLEGDLNDLEYMQANHLVALKSLRLDDAVTGGDLSRPGFRALIDEAQSDRTISHIFFYKRDRLARPQEAFEVALIEKNLSTSGITIVLSGKIVPPIERGEGELSDDIALVLDYHQSGQFLRTLSERIIATQRGLAEQGYWLGGRPPLGFIRILVDASVIRARATRVRTRNLQLVQIMGDPLAAPPLNFRSRISSQVAILAWYFGLILTWHPDCSTWRPSGSSSISSPAFHIT